MHGDHTHSLHDPLPIYRGRSHLNRYQGRSHADRYRGRTPQTIPPSLCIYGERLIPDFQHSVMVSKVIDRKSACRERMENRLVRVQSTKKGTLEMTKKIAENT